MLPWAEKVVQGWDGQCQLLPTGWPPFHRTPRRRAFSAAAAPGAGLGSCSGSALCRCRRAGGFLPDSAELSLPLNEAKKSSVAFGWELLPSFGNRGLGHSPEKEGQRRASPAFSAETFPAAQRGPRLPHLPVRGPQCPPSGARHWLGCPRSLPCLGLRDPRDWSYTLDPPLRV